MRMALGEKFEKLFSRDEAPLEVTKPPKGLGVGGGDERELQL